MTPILSPANAGGRRPARALHRTIRRFMHDETGSQSVEAMLMLPIMIWCFLATYVFFDAYRLQALNFRASYLIGDVMSRSLTEITPEFMDSMHDLQTALIETREPGRLRVTVFRFDAAAQRHDVCWSQTRGGGADITNARLAAMTDDIPDMTDGEISIMVQSQVDYEPIFAAGIGTMSYDNFSITSPRFAGQLIFNSVNDGNGTVGTRVWNCV